MNRREFTQASIFTVIAIGSSFAVKANAKSDIHLRPPRSVKNFNKFCVKCGQCIQVCPYHCISLLDMANGLDIATAYIDPQKRGCYLCDLFPCVLACPSGALSHDSLEKTDANMGVAVITETVKCLSLKHEKVTNKNIEFLITKKAKNDREEKIIDDIKNSIDKICDICVRMCPIGNSAIEFNNFLPVIKNGCVGCGVCVETCPVDIIKVIPHKKFSEIYKD